MELRKKDTIIATAGITAILTIAGLLFAKSKKIRVVPNGVIGSRFGYRIDPITGASGSWHNGQDISAPTGTPVICPEDGVVQLVWTDEVCGNGIKIKHKTLTTGYCHLQKQYVRAGQKVKKGQIIGVVGNTGRSTGSHLHFVVRRNSDNKDINPLTAGIAKF